MNCYKQNKLMYWTATNRTNWCIELLQTEQIDVLNCYKQNKVVYWTVTNRTHWCIEYVAHRTNWCIQHRTNWFIELLYTEHIAVLNCFGCPAPLNTPTFRTSTVQIICTRCTTRSDKRVTTCQFGLSEGSVVLSLSSLGLSFLSFCVPPQEG